MIGTTYDNDDDTELIAKTLAGDRQAFGFLVRRHDLAMRRLASRLVDSTQAMDDVLQDAYLKAYGGLAAFDQRSTFATWLYTITYRTAVDHLRRGKVRHTLPLTEESRPTAGSGHSGVTVDQVVERSLLREALAKLPQDQAATVLLVDGEGLSYRETAEILGVAPGTVGSRVNRARAALRQSIGAMNGGGYR